MNWFVVDVSQCCGNGEPCVVYDQMAWEDEKFEGQRQAEMYQKELRFKQRLKAELVALKKRVASGKSEQKRQRHVDLERCVCACVSVLCVCMCPLVAPRHAPLLVQSAATVPKCEERVGAAAKPRTHPGREVCPHKDNRQMRTHTHTFTSTTVKYPHFCHFAPRLAITWAVLFTTSATFGDITPARRPSN